MPELPEVETIVRGLNTRVKGKKISSVWTDWPRHFVRHEGGFKSFRSEISGATIKRVSRIGKNIIFSLAPRLPMSQILMPLSPDIGSRDIGHSELKMLVHLKMTGRLLFCGKGKELTDKFIHTKFNFADGSHLAFSDVRKFGEILFPKDISERLILGPDALKITLPELKQALSKRKTAIKKALLDQKVLAGVGNIYADEILFTAGVHPLRRARGLKDGELRSILRAIKKILNKAIKLRGTSMSDYRDINGKLGNYYNVRLVYAREGEPCPRCENKIIRIKTSGRSTHFCKKCQK